MKSFKNQGIIFAFLLLIILGGRYLLIKDDKVVDVNRIEERSECKLNSDDCVIKFNNHDLVVSISGEIKPLKPFIVKIVDSSALLSKADVIFRMKEMDMGINRFNFKKGEGNIWLSKVIIPVCTAGRNDWLVEMVIETDNENKKVVFEIVI